MITKQIIFSQYSRERLLKFQTETTLYEEKGKRYTKKRALNSEGVTHVKSMYENYILLNEQCKNVKACKAILQKNEIIFEYINGNTLENLLIKAIINNNEREFFRIIDQYVQLVRGLGTESINNFKSNKEFIEIFGIQFEQEKVEVLEISNIDLIFSNIIIDDNGEFYIIDYEWVFNFKVPILFVIYRSLYYFYLENNYYIEKLKLCFDEILAYVKISKSDKILFDKMEQNFQNYVYGEKKKYGTPSAYFKKAKSVEDLEGSIEDLKQRLQQKDEQIRQRDEQINNIYNLRGWKVLCGYYRFINKVKKK